MRDWLIRPRGRPRTLVVRDGEALPFNLDTAAQPRACARARERNRTRLGESERPDGRPRTLFVREGEALPSTLDRAPSLARARVRACLWGAQTRFRVQFTGSPTGTELVLWGVQTRFGLQVSPVPNAKRILCTPYARSSAGTPLGRSSSDRCTPALPPGHSLVCVSSSAGRPPCCCKAPRRGVVVCVEGHAERWSGNGTGRRRLVCSSLLEVVGRGCLGRSGTGCVGLRG